MYKITNTGRFLLSTGLFFLSTALPCAAQDTLRNQYGLWVITDMATLQRTVAANPAKKMVNLKKAVPGVLLDLRYATLKNFMHTRLYPYAPATYLRQPAAEALAKVQAALKSRGLGLKIFDAYRPYSVTVKMWEPVKDDRYAADPKFGSGHNRGTAVDLTIINLRTKKELPMGTEFDNFSDTAHHNFTALPDSVLANRQLLRKLMEEAGFKALETEWWHYSLPNAKEFELLDIDFKRFESVRFVRHKP